MLALAAAPTTAAAHATTAVATATVAVCKGHAKLGLTKAQAAKLFVFDPDGL